MKHRLPIDKTVKRLQKETHQFSYDADRLKKSLWHGTHSSIIECLDIFGIANNVQNFLKNSMKSWKVEL